MGWLNCRVAMLSKSNLFARLAEGHAARVTVVTPNKRLAQTLMAEFDSFQINQHLSVWEAPDILPFGAFVERLWEDTLYSDLGGDLPLLLTEAQEQHLWQEILKDSSFLLKEGAARQAREAWRLLHQWRIGAGRRCGEAFRLAFGELQLLEKLARLRRQDVEGVGDHQIRFFDG